MAADSQVMLSLIASEMRLRLRIQGDLAPQEYQERFPEFLDELAQRYGWRFGGTRDRHVGGESKASDPFRRRIAADNAADLDFYQHALRVWERRRARVGP